MQKIEHNSLCETETYKGMTDNEIIKALEGMTYGGHSCMHCKYGTTKSEDRCGLQGCKIGRDALDLINRQKAEIERLTNAYKQCAWERDTFQAEVDGLREHLSIPNGEEDEDWYTMPQLKTPKETKTEAIKEFAERLKDIYAVHDGLHIVIDNLVKEMTEVSEKTV